VRADYPDLRRRLQALTEGEDDAVALMATVACEIHHADDRFDWTGFYRVVAPELLKIGPYQGGHGCLVIPFARGVCGAAARTGEVQLVPTWRPSPATSPAPPRRGVRSSSPSMTAKAGSLASSTSTAICPPPSTRRTRASSP
jgi:hypothetical protein